MTSQEIKSNIQQIVNQIVNNFDPEKIILFGSYAWGNPGTDSDIDLCVVKETGDTRQLARQIDSSLTPRYYPLDLLVFQPDTVKKRLIENDPFITEIINRGSLLYEK